MKTKAKKPAAKATKKPAAKVTAKVAVAKKPVRVAVAAAAVLGAGTVLMELATLAKSAAPASGEDLPTYATRVLNDVAGLPDEDFGKLSKPAQDWYNAAANALNEDPPKALPEPTPVAGKAPTSNKAAAPASNKAAPAAKAPKAVKEPKVKEARTPRADGVAHQIRLAVVKKPDITFDQIKSKLKIDGDTGSYNWNRFNEARSVVALVKEHGLPA